MSYTEPILLTLLAVSIAAFLLRRSRSSMPSILAPLSLLLLSWPPIDWLLSRPLEARYPVRAVPLSPVEALTVLSEGVHPPIAERPYASPDQQTYERSEFAAWLYMHWLPVPILACGGPGESGGEPFSITMRRLLEQAGVPASKIWTEERSRSTRENAVYGAEILRQHGIHVVALVVEAKSMMRAEACFRHEGITVVAAPSSFREFGPWSDEILPSWKAIKRNEVTLHEVLGLGWYRVRGWI